MALVKVKKEFVELISEKDEAVVSLEPLVLKEGKDPFVFVFKQQNDLSVRRDYLLNIIKLQQILSVPDVSNEKDIQSFISKLPAEEQLDLMDKVSEHQLYIVDLLFVGYREKVGGDLKEKTPDILDLMKDNDVIVEFFTKLTKGKSEVVDEKKS